MNQGCDERRKAVEPHEEYDRLRRYVWRWRRRDALTPSACADQHSVGHAPVRRRNLGKQGRRERACHTGEHYWGKSIVLEIGVLFSAAAIKVRVSLLKSEHRVTFLQGLEAKSEKFRLRSVGVARKLARYLNRGAAGDKI